MEHPVLIPGALLAGAATLAILFRFARQSSIIAFIAVGIVAGLLGALMGCLAAEHGRIPHELTISSVHGRDVGARRGGEGVR